MANKSSDTSRGLKCPHCHANMALTNSDYAAPGREANHVALLELTCRYCGYTRIGAFDPELMDMSEAQPAGEPPLQFEDERISVANQELAQTEQHLRDICNTVYLHDGDEL